MRARQNQVSTPNPEFGVDFDASARAMHQSALKGSLMVHETAFSTPAASRKSLGATLFERNTMLKTLKRKIALVAVAGLGFGLVSTVPAFAAITAGGVLVPSADGSSKYAALAVNGGGFATSIAVYSGSTVNLNLSVTGADGDTETTVLTGGGNLTVVSGAGIAGSGTATLTTTTNTGNLTRTGIVSFAAGTPTAVNMQTTTDAAITNLTAISSSISASNSGPVRAASGVTANVKWSATAGEIRPTATVAPMVYTSIAKPSGSNVTFSPATGLLDLATSGGATVGTIRVDVAGSYTGLMFWDMNGNTTAESSEPQVIYTFNTSAAATQLDVQAAQSAASTQAKEFSVALKAADGSLTQALPNEFVSISAVAATGTVTLSDGVGTTTTGNGTTLVANTTGGAATASTAYISYADFADGYVNFKVAGNTANDTITITVTPSATLAAAGATAKTTTLNVVPANAATTMKATVTTGPLLVADAANTTATLNAYKASVDVTTVVFNVTGLTPNSSYTADITLSANAGGRTATLDGAAYVIAAGGANAGTDVVRTSSATGTDTYTLVLSGGLANNETITLDLDAAGAGTQTNARVAVGSLAYTNTVSAPATSPSIAISGTAITIAGTIADQFSNPVGGVTVSVSGSVTPSGTALSGSAITGNDGKYSISITPAAATTSVTFTISSARTGLTIAAVTRVVNLTTGGDPTVISVVTNPVSTTTAIPAVLVPFAGRATNTSNETWTLATATAAATLDATGVDAGDNCVAVTPTTTPAAQVVLTGSTGVLFFDSACANDAAHDLSAGVATLTVASGTQVWVTTTKTGTSTITMTSGKVVKTADIYAVNSIGRTAGGGLADSKDTKAGAAARNVDVTGPASLDTNGISTVTIKITDAFGNPVEITNTVTVAASVTGKALLSGNAVTATVGTTNAAGQAVVALIGLASEGDAVVTVTGSDITNAQFTSAAGAANSTTAGTNGLTASVATKSLTVPVKAAAAAANTEITAVKSDVTSVKADVKAVSDTVATLSKAVTTIQSSVTELTSSFATQIKSLTDAIAKISKAIAALSKKVSAKK